MVNFPSPPAPEPLTEPASADTMERVPEKYILDEDDIREAITEWINLHHQNEYDFEYSIEFKTSEKRSPGRGLPGGMNDDIVTTVITAVAHKDD